MDRQCRKVIKNYEKMLKKIMKITQNTYEKLENNRIRKNAEKRAKTEQKYEKKKFKNQQNLGKSFDENDKTVKKNNKKS